MSFDDTINVYFVTTTAGEENVEFATVLTYLRGHIPEENIRHIKASEGFPFIASGQLTKKDVFVFDKFQGDFFEQLQIKTKSLIVGPRCLNTCLIKCEPIPLGTSPVYTTAMRDLQISATGITPKEKEQLRVHIQWMGGHYFQNFGRNVTHLVSNTIKSSKYEHATINGIPVMHVDWVQRVWERSCVDNVAATDGEFDKYRLPIFFGTNITCTGLSTEKKNEIMRLVNENGGTYHRAFRSQLVDIVITERNKTNSEKYNAAVSYKKDILTPEWVFDSVAKGFALPPKAYQVKSLKVSTPTKTDQSIADFTATDHTNLSDISRISVAGVKRANSLVNDTICSTLNETQQQQPPAVVFAAPTPPVAKSLAAKLQRAAAPHYRLVYDEICPTAAKKAGTFLDGCCIYLSGFRLEEREKLNRILNVGGATRYDVLNEKITHIIVGQLDDAEFKAWKRHDLLTAVHIVHLDWLLESIKLKQAASEIVYRVSLPTLREPDAPSPSSKRTLRSMNHSFKQPDLPIKKKLFDTDTDKAHANNTPELLKPLASSTEKMPVLEEDVNNLIAQYSQENEPIALMPQPAKSAATTHDTTTTAATVNNASALQPVPSDLSDAIMTTIDYESLDFFQGMSLFIDQEHFPEEFYTQMIAECEAARGNVVAASFKDPVDYAIVSFERTIDVHKLPVQARHIITELYVEACMKQNKLVPIEYYHHHIPHTADAMPLQGMTIVVSIYTGLERDFIDSIAQLLGAKINKNFAKKERPLLVCPTPEGSKYEGALKWRFPVVNSNWLVQCAAHGERVSYEAYLVGDCPAEFPTSPTLRERNTANATTTPMAALNANESENNELQPGVEQFTPLRNKRVSELAGPRQHGSTTNSPDSPQTPVNNFARASYNFDFMDGILAEITNEAERECLREVILEMRNNQTPELERIRRQACTPINRKIVTPKGIPEFCTTPEFEKRIADEFEKRWRLPTKKLKPDTPIDEIRKRVMRATCKAMGIPVSDDEEQQQAKTGSANASNANTPLLHRNSTATHAMPRSIFAQTHTPTGNCSVNRTSTFVPNTQTPNGSNDVRRRSSLLGKSTINFDKLSFEETEIGAAAATITMGEVSKRNSTVAASSPELKQITEYLKNCESRRQSMKRSAANEVQPHCENEVAGSETHYVQPFESEQFCAGTEMVDWRDPAEFVMQRRSKTFRVMQHQGTPRFTISCVSEATRSDVIAKILQLGGEVCENLVNFDPLCTHFLCERPNRGEKMFGCISAGKWVLSLQYIEECHAKDAFIDEELCEWGNCKALNLPTLTLEEQNSAQAAHRWRKQLSAHAPNTGAFTNFRVLLHAERNVEALKNIIRAGKGEIIEATTPYSKSNGAHLATHCFVDVKKKPLQPADFRFLQEHGVKVYSQLYINAHLMNDNASSDFSKYEVHM